MGLQQQKEGRPVMMLQTAADIPRVLSAGLDLSIRQLVCQFLFAHSGHSKLEVVLELALHALCHLCMALASAPRPLPHTTSLHSDPGPLQKDIWLGVAISLSGGLRKS